MTLQFTTAVLERIWMRNHWNGTRWYQRSCQWFRAMRERIVGMDETNRRKIHKALEGRPR